MSDHVTERKGTVRNSLPILGRRFILALQFINELMKTATFPGLHFLQGLCRSCIQDGYRELKAGSRQQEGWLGEEREDKDL